METLGKYTLLKKIAVGGMAEIWVASTSNAGIPRVCVVKRILPHLVETAEFVRMFLDEARIVGSLTHPNLVQLFDVGQVEGRPFIAMEFLHGADLRSIKRALKNRGAARMPIEHALNVIMGAASGLHYAHEKLGLDGKPLNIVHRDISPQNLLVTYDGGVKVLDFGIAKSDAHTNETKAGTLKGKIPYMAPEQCLCEPLDRRADIYALGVVLYELTTGHRAVPAKASEYEMIRGIVEGALTPPTKLEASYPPVLEAIVLKCLAKDRGRRYPTARALLADLEAFAREERLATTQLSLTSYMSDLFGKRVEAWREALAAGGAQLAELAVTERDAPAEAPAAPIERPTATKTYGALLEGRAKAAFFEPPRTTEPPAATTVRPPAAAPDLGGDVAVTRRRVGGVEVVALAGKINERFQGKALGASLAGQVVLDLAGITRLTSFGVREWLQMLGEAGGAELYLARCAEPVVNQLSMIKGFAGGARVVSFAAPYRCEACGGSFERLLDCERDADAVREARPPAAACPRCGGSGVFDDDAESYLAFAAAHAGVAVPAKVRAALADPGLAGPPPGEALEKVIEGRTTRITVRGNLDASLRWKRVLDGIEGDLEVDLGEVVSAVEGGAAAFENAVRALGPEVEVVRLHGCPRLLAERLLAGRSRATLASVCVDGRCDACDAARAATIPLAEARAAAREERDPYVPCKRCSAPLSFAEARSFLELLAGEGSRPSAPISAVNRTGNAQVTSARAPAGPSRARTVAAAVAILLGVGGTAALVLPGRRPPPAPPALGPVPPARASVAPAPSAAPEGPPAWATIPIAVEGDALLVVGRGVGATEEAALGAAREDAVDVLAGRVLEDLGDGPVAAFVRARLPRDPDGARRAESLSAVAARWTQQVGGHAAPERVEARVERKGAGASVLARYRVGKAGMEAARAFYARTASAGGLTVAPVFPLLLRSIRAQGALVVIAVDRGGAAARAGVREGDVVLAVDGRPVSTPEALAGPAGLVEMKIEEGGAARVVKLPR